MIAFMLCSMTIWVMPSFLMSRISLDDLFAFGGIEAAHDLVEQQQLGPCGKDARDLELLAFADGQAAGLDVGALLQMDDLELFPGRRARLA